MERVVERERERAGVGRQSPEETQQGRCLAAVNVQFRVQLSLNKKLFESKAIV